MIKLRITGEYEEVQQMLEDVKATFEVLWCGNITPQTGTAYYRVFLDVKPKCREE